jgi:hypothetical protein
MLGHTLESLQALTFREIMGTLPLGRSSPVSAIRARAGQLVELAHRDGSIVRAQMSKSAMLRGDDPVALATFTDLTEQLWIEPQRR